MKQQSNLTLYFRIIRTTRMKFFIISAFLLTVLLTSCSAEKALQALNVVVVDDHFTKTENLRYGTDKRQQMDFYRPVESDNAEDSSLKPLVVFIHGGAWRTGSKEEYEFVAAALTRQGHPVLIPNYRLYPLATFPDFVTDIAAAIARYQQWSSQSQAEDALSLHDKVILMGHSSGAHQAALLATDPTFFEKAGVTSDLAGLIALSGPYNLPLDNQEVSVVFPNVEREESVNPVLQVQQFSPLRSSRFPPTLLIHGKDDERVTIRHTLEFASALRGKGVTVTKEILRGGHAGAVIALAPPLEFLNDSLESVEKYLQEVSDTPNP